MQGASIKVSDATGRSWTVPFAGAQLSVGRDADNDLVLGEGGVSSHHCVFGRDPSGALMVEDRGSTNGTWIGEHRSIGPTRVDPGAEVIVGSYVLTVQLAPAQGARSLGPGLGPSLSLGAVAGRGSLLRSSEDERRARRFHDRVARYAREWDAGGRPGRLLLRGRNLSRAAALLDLGGAEEVLDDLEESFVRASVEGRQRGRLLQRVGIGAGVLAVAGGLALVLTCDGREGADGNSTAAAAEQQDQAGAAADGDEFVELGEAGGAVEHSHEEVQRAWIEHTVVPTETLEEIAARYQVPLQSLARWNSVGVGDVLTPKTTLRVRTDPRRAPLPQQEIAYVTERRESWSSLAKRFDVSVAKLRAYNPELGDRLKAKTELTIWIDPKPLRRKSDVQLPSFEVRQDAISVGAPKDGRIENSIQFPRNDALYKRRYPFNMYCAAHMAEHLQAAIAAFRYNYEFEGEIVVADMSRQGGGPFPPHKSHQSGRDVDVWLPILKGVYKKNHLERQRRPNPEEADWFALYGFLQALHDTDAVEAVFLDYTLHDRVYQAAKLMGARDEELDEMIAYPRGAHYRGSLLQHSPAHVHHVHIRFKCGPQDLDCKNFVDRDPGD